MWERRGSYNSGEYGGRGEEAGGGGRGGGRGEEKILKLTCRRSQRGREEYSNSGLWGRGGGSRW